MRFNRPSIGRIVSGAVAVGLAPLLPILALSLLPPHHNPAIAADTPTRPAFYVSAPMLVSSEPTIVIESGTFHLADASRYLRTTDRSLAQAQAHVATLGIAAFKGETVVLNAPLIRIALTDRSLSALGGGSGVALPLLKAMQQLPFDQLTLHHATIEIADKEASRTITLGELDANLTRNARRGDSTLSGSFQLNGQRLTFSAVLGPNPEAAAKPGSAVETGDAGSLQFSVNGALIDATFKGLVRYAKGVQLAGEASVSIPNIKQLSRWLGQPIVPVSGFRNFKADGKLTWANSVIGLDNARFSMDGNAAVGTMSLNVAGVRPAFDGTLAFNTLDLSPLFGAHDALSFWRSKSNGDAAADLRIRLISQLDADLRISATRMTTPFATFGHSAATVSIKNGRLLADFAELETPDLEGGAKGQLVADMSGPVPLLSAQGDLDNFEARNLLKLLNAPVILQGQARAKFDLSLAGGSSRTMLHELSGTVLLAMDRSGRLGLDLRRLWFAAQKGPVTGWSGSSGHQTSFDELTARLSLSKGLISAQRVDVKFGEMSMSAVGTADILNSKLDVKIVSHGGASGAPATSASDSPPGPIAMSSDDLKALLVTGAASQPLIQFGLSSTASATPPDGLLDNRVMPLPATDDWPR